MLKIGVLPSGKTYLYYDITVIFKEQK